MSIASKFHGDAKRIPRKPRQNRTAKEVGDTVTFTSTFVHPGSNEYDEIELVLSPTDDLDTNQSVNSAGRPLAKGKASAEAF